MVSGTGDVPRAAILALAKLCFLVLSLVFALPPILGEPGGWLGSPIGECLLLGLTFMVLTHGKRVWGVVGPLGKSREKTSGGPPHLVI